MDPLALHQDGAEVNDPSLQPDPRDPDARELHPGPEHRAVPHLPDQLRQAVDGGERRRDDRGRAGRLRVLPLQVPRQERALIAVLALQMISPLVVAVPLYRYFARIDLLDSHFSTTMVYIAILMPLATWMLKGFFDEIPTELDEAAMVDGANRFQAFWQGDPAGRAARRDGRVPAHGDPGVGRVRRPVHPAERAVAAAGLGRDPQLPGHLCDRRRPTSWRPAG